MNLFTRLFGRPDNGVREMDFIGAQRMVLDYARYLEGASPMPGQVLDASCLPHDKELLRDALLFCISNSSDPRLEEHLKAGFLMLSAFQHGVGEAGAGVEFAALDLDADMLDTAHHLEMQQERSQHWSLIAGRELQQMQEELNELELELAQSMRLSA